uniref:F-box domain-containing protein n=1 Tax=Homalodisca liturata TaxID=320908 RepID=A0A1B6H8B8_9HEMI
MSETSGIFSLPPEILCYIGSYLTPKDLLALSGSCHYLRAVYNTDTLWEEFTDKRLLNMTLDSTTSLVLPKYCELQSSTLEPLCKHRASFLKQSRLVSNMRQQNFVKHTIPFDGYLSDFKESLSVNKLQITYNDVYLFVLDHRDGCTLQEVVKVYNIEEVPYLIATFKIESHNPDVYAIVIWIQVVGNKLVVCKDDWFDVYHIQLPIKEFPILYSVQMSGPVDFELNRPIILGHFLFVGNNILNNIHVWNLEDGKKLDDIVPRNQGPDFGIVGYSKDFKFVILFSSISYHLHQIFVYDIESMQYTSFCPVLNKDVMIYETYGFMDAHHVVLLSWDEDLSVGYIFVYCYNTSTLLAEKEFEATGPLDSGNIIDNFFVFPIERSVVVMDLRTLDTIASLEIGSDIFFECPQTHLLSVGYIEIVSHVQHIIVMMKINGAEVWDFERRIKLMDLVSEFKCIAVNETHSKLIVCGEGTLSVFNFW